MNKVLFATNLPSPYRVDFFNEIGKKCDLTVLFERKTSAERDEKWKGETAENYREVFLDLVPVGADRSKGSALRKYIMTHKFDALVFTNYVSTSVMEAIAYCRFKRIPYIIEYDGGFNKKDKLPQRMLKKFLLGGAKAHFTTCELHKQYLCSLGIAESKIRKYPFSSVHEAEISAAGILSDAERCAVRARLGVKERKVVLAVGQFIHRKGFDILMDAMPSLPPDTGVYIIGGIPTDEYIRKKQQLKLHNLHFVRFLTKHELYPYMQMADVLVMPTREDIWGLVVNEAMAFGLPVVSSDQCIAGLEMITNGENGYIVPTDDPAALAKSIAQVLQDPKRLQVMREKAQQKAIEYTIESMVKSNIDHLRAVLYKT